MYIVWSFLVFLLIVVFASNGFAAKQGIIVSSGAATSREDFAAYFRWLLQRHRD